MKNSFFTNMNSTRRAQHDVIPLKVNVTYPNGGVIVRNVLFHRNEKTFCTGAFTDRLTFICKCPMQQPNTNLATFASRSGYVHLLYYSDTNSYEQTL